MLAPTSPSSPLGSKTLKSRCRSLPVLRHVNLWCGPPLLGWRRGCSWRRRKVEACLAALLPLLRRRQGLMSRRGLRERPCTATGWARTLPRLDGGGDGRQRYWPGGLGCPRGTATAALPCPSPLALRRRRSSGRSTGIGAACAASTWAPARPVMWARPQEALVPPWASPGPPPRPVSA